MLEIKEYDGAKPRVVKEDKEKNMAKLTKKPAVKKAPKKAAKPVKATKTMKGKK